MSKYYCIKCGRNHRESSQIARKHVGISPNRFLNMDPKLIAIGIAMKTAIPDHGIKPDAAKKQIIQNWQKLGFDDQFDVNPTTLLKTLDRENLISHGRHSGKSWYGFLANDWSTTYGLSPSRYHRIIKNYAADYGRL